MNDFRAFLVFTLIACLSGCGGLLTKPENKALAKAAVQYATRSVIIKARVEDREAKRERIRNIAADIQVAVKDDEQATIPLLDQLVHDRVPWSKLSEQDQLLAQTLIDVVEAELRARVGDNTIPPDQLLVVFEVMQWVIDATKMGEAPQ
jgi:hypothetical protein